MKDEHGIERKYTHGFSGIDPEVWARIFGDKKEKKPERMCQENGDVEITVTEKKITIKNKTDKNILVPLSEINNAVNRNKYAGAGEETAVTT